MMILASLLACGSSSTPETDKEADPASLDGKAKGPGKAPKKASLDPVESPAKGLAVVALQDVSANAHPTGDRVAFEVSDMPGYHVAYIDKVEGCASGEPIAVAGQAWLEVALRPAVGHTEAGQATVAFNDKAVDLGTVKALRSTCDFESDVTWVIGVSAKVPFRVAEAKDPTRLVIDFPSQ